MGYILSHQQEEEFFVERRSDSIVIGEEPDNKERHVFGERQAVEFSNEFFAKILAFFGNPANRVLCGLEVPSPAQDAQ